MKFAVRVVLYCFLAVLGTVAIIGRQVYLSQMRLESDPSAMAWIGFLPYIWPIFAIEVVKYVAVFAACTESAVAVLQMIRRSSEK